MVGKLIMDSLTVSKLETALILMVLLIVEDITFEWSPVPGGMHCIRVDPKDFNCLNSIFQGMKK